MTIEFTSNITTIEKNVRRFIEGLGSEPVEARIYNDAPYARALEHGSYQEYTRKEPRKQEDQGTFKLPKGGTSVRFKYKTRVRQPPKRIMARSRTNIKNYGVKQMLARSLKTRGDVVRASNQVAVYAKEQFKFRSPQSKVTESSGTTVGKRFIDRWQIDSAK